MGFKAIPQSARQIASLAGICHPEPKREKISNLALAEKRIREIGQGVSLEWCKNLKCWPRKIEWETTLRIK